MPFSAWPIRSSFTDPTQVHMVSSLALPSELRDPHPVSPATAAPVPAARNVLLLSGIRLTWRFLVGFRRKVSRYVYVAIR
ncbi:hypothetical protein GCM10009534_56010 [Kribbella sandramycini]